MTEYNFKEKIESLLQNQRRTKKSLYDALGMSMQGFDAMMKNNSFTAVRIGQIAKFFDISISDLYGHIEPSTKNERVPDGGGQYLQEHLATLEQNFEKLLEQLTVKDTQIAGLQESQRTLQDMLKLVLGKSESAALTQLSSEEKLFYSMLDQYTLTGLSQFSDVLAPGKHIFATPALVKSVALG